MRYRILAALSFILMHFASWAQSPQPWWVLNPPVDSADIERRLLADSILNYAYSFKGVPYVWGGSEPETGFDCSGFICYVYRKYGIELPRTSAEQFNAGIPVPYTEAERGDLILFTGMDLLFGTPGHVGIIISRDENNVFTFIHTASPKTGGVHISKSTDPSFYRRFLEIRRVIDIH